MRLIVNMNRRLNSYAGFSLIEVLVAGLIIGIVVIAMVTMVRTGRELDVSSDHRRQARALIHAAFEDEIFSYVNYQLLNPALHSDTSTIALENVKFDTKFNPEGWTVEFDPKEIDNLAVLDEQNITVKITPPDKTIAGDYMMKISVVDNSRNATAEAEIRVTVLTPTIWGWVGVIIVVLVVIGLMVMFWRLGRR